MSRFRFAAGRTVLATVGVGVALALSACASRAPAWRPPPTSSPTNSSYATSAPDQAVKPPYPVDPDPNAVYCLCWVPPRCREVPRLVCCEPEKCCTEKVFRRKVEFAECCEPGCYTEKKCPDRCRTEEIIVGKPGHKEWVRADCCDPCVEGCECYRQIDVPPCYRVCEKTVTEEGVKYCAFKPPRYHLEASLKTVCVDRPVHVPGKYKVEWCKEEFECGHWEWRRTTHCAPQPCAPCAPSACPPLRKGDFSYAPAKD